MSGNQECLNQALIRFRKWLDNNVDVDPDIRTYVYSYGMQESGRAQDWDTVWYKYLAERSASEKSKLLGALTSTRDPLMLQKLILYAEDPALITDQDYFTVMQNIAGNIVGTQLVWNYVRNNWLKLVDRFSLNDRRLGTFISNICGSFNTQLQLEEMQQFFNKYPDAGTRTY